MAISVKIAESRFSKGTELFTVFKCSESGRFCRENMKNNGRTIQSFKYGMQEIPRILLLFFKPNMPETYQGYSSAGSHATLQCFHKDFQCLLITGGLLR